LRLTRNSVCSKILVANTVFSCSVPTQHNFLFYLIREGNLGPSLFFYFFYLNKCYHIFLDFILLFFCCHLVLFYSYLGAMFLFWFFVLLWYLFIQICRVVSIQFQCRFNDFSNVNIANPDARLFWTFKFCHINCRFCHRH
jgi:hypothetical protein